VLIVRPTIHVGTISPETNVCHSQNVPLNQPEVMIPHAEDKFDKEGNTEWAKLREKDKTQ